MRELAERSGGACEAEAADKAKSSFLAVMSHEIRTPLGGVIGMLDLMLNDALTEEQAERARIASASAHGLLQLLNEVRDVTRLEADGCLAKPIDISALNSVLAGLEPRSSRHDRTLVA